MSDECFICVDVETAGPNPADYSLLSVGAALVSDPQQTFYAELKPLKPNFTEEAQTIHGLSMAALAEAGLEPREAMQRFADWLDEVRGGRPPVFVAFNAPFDWMFVADYFHHYLDGNPFGHRALDIKALYLGLHGGRWEDTTFHHISSHYGLDEYLNHNALDDARQGAAVFAAILAEIKEATNA
ncbi:MAG: 3'-5' exonuclease [Anaerolineales bacterium]|nr:3'-5' exonuclease [Anaerolineales bacterium]